LRPEREYRSAINLLAAFRRCRKFARWQLLGMAALAALLAFTAMLIGMEIIASASSLLRGYMYHIIVYAWGAGAVLLVLGTAVDFLLFRRTPPDFALAEELGIRDDAVKDRLLNALQLHTSPEAHHRYSSVLIDQALIRIVRELPSDLKRLIPRTGRRRAGKVLGATTALILLLALWQGTTGLDAFKRLYYHDQVFADPDLVAVALAPGDTTLIRGEDLLIEAFPAQTLLPDDPQLAVTRADQQFIYPLLRQGNRFTLLLENLNHPLVYHISGRNLVSDTCRVKLLDRPQITGFRIAITYPAYTGLLPLTLDENIGSFSAVYSSRVDFHLQASKELTDAQINFGSGETIAMEQTADGYHARMIVRQDNEYSFLISDVDGLTNNDPITWTIAMIPDSKPVLILAAPQDGEQVTRQVVFLGSGVDDFGITRYQLRYRFVSPFLHAQYEDFSLAAATAEELAEWPGFDLPFQQLDGGETLLDYNWDLTRANVLPEDEILLFIDLWDNDNVSGPKYTRSPLLRLNVPGTAALYEAARAEEEAELERARDIVEHSRANQERLQELMTELRVDPEQMDWEKQRQVEQILQEQLELAESAAAMQENLEQLKDALAENQLFSSEVMKKLQKLTELLQELMTDEMKELLEQLQQNREPTPEELQTALEQVKQELDVFLEQMERLLSILEQLQMEQKLEELARLAEELRRQQESLNEQAAAESPPEDLAEQQEKLARDTEDLQQAIEETRSEYEDNPHFPKEEMAEASDFMQEAQLAERMSSNAQQMQSDPAGTVPEGHQLAMDLGQLQQMLQNASEQARQSAFADMNAAIDQLVHRLLVISQLYEELQKDVTDLQPENTSFGECAFRQLSLTRSLFDSIQEVAALMMQSFFISKNVWIQLNDAATQSQEGIRQFEERDLASLAKREGRIMASVNRAVYALLQSQQNMNASMSSTGFQEMMEQLMQASSDQQCLNSQCQKLMGAQQGSCPKPMGVSLSDLAGEQARLRRQMEQLSQQASEMTGGRKPLGDLGEIAAQMREVEEQLQDRQYTERTRKLQERILNRLLDSQRSIREKERSRERESRTGRPVTREAPMELTPDMTADAMRRQLMRALKEGYSREYLNLIRGYYQRLIQLEQERAETESP